jgi:hypothetical protein
MTIIYRASGKFVMAKLILTLFYFGFDAPNPKAAMRHLAFDVNDPGSTPGTARCCSISWLLPTNPIC